MRYAEVSVNSPIAQRRTFCYTIPPNITVNVGQAVWVPFGEKLLQGIVLELSDHPSVEATREIAGIIDPTPLLSPIQVNLARCISKHYLAPLFDTVALMLPPGFERKTITFISNPSPSHSMDTSSLTLEQQKALELVQKQDKVSLRELEKVLGKKKAQIIISQLIGQGLAVRSYELEPLKVKPKAVPYLRLSVEVDEARQEAAKLRKKGAIRQASLLDFLIQQAEPIALAKVRQNVGTAASIVKAVIDKGLVEIQHVETKRDPLAYQSITPSSPLTLTAAQRSALESIKSNLLKAPPSVFLLHGVTGSG